MKFGPDEGNSGAIIRWGKYWDNGIWIQYRYKRLWFKWRFRKNYINLGFIRISWGN